MTESALVLGPSAVSQEHYAYASAKAGSEALLERLLAYFARHHPDSALGRCGRGLDRLAGGIGFAGRGTAA
jgi:hypothetical protein